jgi:anti-sigma regulatory factor (Ser/Thr protein kinase)
VARALSADSITLSIPHEKPYHGVARLVVGGLAARLELSYEHLEDLQLALESVLESEGYVDGDEVTVHLLVGPGSVVMEIGPLDPRALRADLEQDAEEEEEEGISLSRLLSTLVEEVSIEEADGGHRLRLEKRVPMTRPEPREPV